MIIIKDRSDVSAIADKSGLTSPAAALAFSSLL
jgi:hypothetical protein